MDLRFNCYEVATTANGYKSVEANITGVEPHDVLDQFSIKDVIDHFGEDRLLEHIGVTAAADHFNLIESHD